jgi:hypothetical protein
MAPPTATWRRNSSAKAVLPIPGSPVMNTICRSPFKARFIGRLGPTRVEADSEPKRNFERTTISVNGPRLCDRRPSLGPDLPDEEAIEC